MRRREFITLLGGAAAAWPQRAHAQTPAKVYRVGVLNSASPDLGPWGVRLIRGLARYGYARDRNLAFESRGAEGHADRLPQLVAELVASKVDVIFASGYRPAFAAKQGTTLPVVVFSAGDPIGTGLVESLARPGGHVTGISDVSAEVTPKRLELLKQFAPSLRRVAVLWNADDLAMSLRYVASEAGARAMGVSVQPLGVREPADFDQAFRAMNREPPDAILMVSDQLTNLNRERVFEFAEAHRLPAIYEYDFIARAGGLMSYGPDLDECFDRVGGLIDRLLKGAKPEELPFEEPTRFQFVLNLKAAKSIGFDRPSR
ncbi:putative ABC transport system substrate-binding protein [Rhizobiales bacterium GAS113]|nr:putative ABC transport system substrate-binding protein [Rhizobiales bacterium GAS113]